MMRNYIDRKITSMFYNKNINETIRNFNHINIYTYRYCSINY